MKLNISNHLFGELIKINVLYSAWINLKHFGIEGLLKMPIIIQYGASFHCRTKNGIQFLNSLKLNMLTIKTGCIITIEIGGLIVFTGDRACFGVRNFVLVQTKGFFEIGNNFWSNRNSEFHCNNSLKIGNDVLVSIHVMIIDTDYHSIYDNRMNLVNPDKEISIGNKVWIGYNVTILKGTRISNNIVLGANSLVLGKLMEENSIYAGNPAIIRRKDITWCLNPIKCQVQL